MELKEVLKGAAFLIHIAVLLMQIRRWEREMRNASRNYQLCRTETAHKRLNELRDEVAQLRAEMAKACEPA